MSANDAIIQRRSNLVFDDTVTVDCDKKLVLQHITHIIFTCILFLYNIQFAVANRLSFVVRFCAMFSCLYSCSLINVLKHQTEALYQRTQFTAFTESSLHKNW